MALIHCPECDKEIPDRVKSCPFCNYKYDLGEIQQVELVSVRMTPKDPVKRKKLIVGAIATVSLLIVSLVIFLIISNISKRAYMDNLDAARFAMLDGANDAESLLDLTARVWFNAIYGVSDFETVIYTMGGTSGICYGDVHTSLKRLFSANSTKATILSFEDNQAEVELMMKELQNPPKGLEVSYSTITDLYSVYKSLTDLAINPSGTLNTFTSSKSENVDRFNELFNTLETQIPEY
ncbi:hypothetical protein ACFLXB_05115 [Chloroflexota bacterium]